MEPNRRVTSVLTLDAGAESTVPVFRVSELGPSAAKLIASGAPQLHKPMDIGEGKRVVTFRDPDGNALRLIQIDDPSVRTGAHRLPD